MIAWTHDLTATNSDSALPNPTQPPWSLMRTSAKNVTYVATSELRAAEIKANLKPAVEPTVIPNMVDPMRLFGISPEMRASLLALEIPWRDFVFLLPARVMVRKNIDFAIEIVKKLLEQGRNPLLLITAAKVADSPASEHYGAFLRQSLPDELNGHVYFLSDFFLVQDDTMRDLLSPLGLPAFSVVAGGLRPACDRGGDAPDAGLVRRHSRLSRAGRVGLISAQRPGQALRRAGVAGKPVALPPDTPLPPPV